MIFLVNLYTSWLLLTSGCGGSTIESGLHCHYGSASSRGPPTAAIATAGMAVGARPATAVTSVASDMPADSFSLYVANCSLSGVASCPATPASATVASTAAEYCSTREWSSHPCNLSFARHSH
jgi:hypothetical protein